MQKLTKMSIKLNLLLMGKTGEGKSSTGNFLLQRFDEPFFAVSCKTTSVTTFVDYNFSEFGGHTLLVVDGPGLADTGKSKVKDVEEAVTNMATALAMCYGGVDAFLLVIKFGSKFTNEDKSALEALKRIFGPTYMNHVIVVVTGGDLFQNEMEDEKCKLSFHEWCETQEGEFRELYDNCNGRFVLLNKREKDEDKRLSKIAEIVGITHGLRKTYGRYTSKFFQDADEERKRMIKDLKAEELTLEIQEKVSLLIFEIQKLPEQPSTEDIDKLQKRIKDMKDEIEFQDPGHDMIVSLKKTVENVEENLKDTVMLRKLATELELIRRPKTLSNWNILSQILLRSFIPFFPDLEKLNENFIEKKIKELKEKISRPT